uniref:Uncharacterized protein n=1 Tax=Oryza glumipatula TaxID=40148 RepID=A0A0D9YEF0_9ORYZ
MGFCIQCGAVREPSLARRGVLAIAAAAVVKVVAQVERHWRDGDDGASKAVVGPRLPLRVVLALMHRQIRAVGTDSAPDLHDPSPISLCPGISSAAAYDACLLSRHRSRGQGSHLHLQIARCEGRALPAPSAAAAPESGGAASTSEAPPYASAASAPSPR